MAEKITGASNILEAIRLFHLYHSDYNAEVLTMDWEEI
jgi:hypothetical protein